MINSMWQNWYSDAEDDGFEPNAYLKNSDDELVYPEIKDWTVQVKLYEAETDYDKYGDFDTHKLDLLHYISFAANEVKYEQYINLPYVRVPEEQITKLTSDLKYVWIEATFTSPTYGTLSASESKISFYKK